MKNLTRTIPRIGDIVDIKPAYGKGDPLKGIVIGVRQHKEDSWSGAEVIVQGESRWVTRTQILGIVGRPRGISRIDQPTRRTHGWFVRMDYQGKSPRLAKLFSDQKYHGIAESLRAAIEFYAAEKQDAPIPQGIVEPNSQA